MYMYTAKQILTLSIRDIFRPEMVERGSESGQQFERDFVKFVGVGATYFLHLYLQLPAQSLPLQHHHLRIRPPITSHCRT